MNTSNFDTKQRFGFRKHRWAKGLASVLLGLSFVGVGSVVTGTNTVHADELGKADQANASLQEARDQANSGSNTQALGLNKVPNSGLRVQRFAAKPVTNDQDIDIDYDSDGNPIIPSQPGHPGDNYNVNVNYDADEHHTTIHYNYHYNDDQGKEQVQEQGHADVSGYTDQTVRPGTSNSNTGADDKNATYDPNLPDGWKLKDGQKLPDISFSGNATGVNDAGQLDPNSHNAQDDKGVDVSIEHNSGKVAHTKPGQDIPKPGDTIPGSTGNKFKEDPNNPGKVAGLTDKELDKTISETIDIDVPEGYTKPASKTDSVQFSRGATVDSVDGKVTGYDDWVASDGKNGKLADQTIDGIPGYVINVDGNDVGAESASYTILGPTVTGAASNIHHTVTYVAQGGKVKTVDIVDTTDGSQNHSFTLSGNTDQTVMPSDSEMHLVDGLELASPDDTEAYNKLKNNGYKLKAGDTSQATNNHIVINVEHKKITISTDKDIPAEAISPDGGTTTKKITRTITVKTPNHDDRTTTDKTDTQTVTFTRTGTYDAVTKTIAWNNYTSDHPQFDEYAITAIPGYNVSVTKGDASELASDGSKLNAKTITSAAQNDALTVEYAGTAHETNYIFHDDIDKANVGDVITAGGRTDQDFLLNGKTDESVNLKVPAGYKLVSVEHGDGSVDKTDQLPTDVKMSIGGKDTDKTVILHLTHDTRTITPGKDITPGQTIPGDHHNSGDTDPNTPLSYTDVHKSVTREYTIDAAPGQEAKSDKETLTFERTATIDLVTGHVDYTKWAPVAGSEDNFKNIDYLHSIDGYTTNYNGAKASDLNATNYSDDDITALKDGDKKTIHVSYDAKGAHQDYRFLDDAGNVVNMDGSVNTDKSVISVSEPGDNTGKTGDTYNKPTTPAGWVLKDGETIGGPDRLVPQDQMKVVEVHVVHGKTTIKPGDLPNPGDTKPGDHSKPGDDKPNRAISYDDLHKELDRTITVNAPHTGANTTTDKISFERTATIDSKDGSVSFGDWTPVDPAKNSFAEFDAPVVDGYTPSVAKVDGKTFITSDDVDQWSDPNVKIDYTAKDAHQDYIFKDADGKVIGENGEKVPTGQTTSTTVTGKTDGKITKPPVPAGWEIVGGGEIGGPTKFMPDDTSTPVEVTVQHSHTVINPDDPKVKDPGDKISGNPDKKPGDGTPKTDISYDNLNTTITRTVTATDPKDAKIDLSQSIAYHRTATIDNVTGDVTFGDWTPVDPAKNSFTDVVVPTVPGYTPEYKKGSADDLKAETPTQDQINNWTNPDVQIGYTANNASKSYKFVGDGKVINQDGTPNDDENAVTITVNGKTDEDIPAVNVPTGWELVNGQTIQGGKFTPDENDTQTIQIEHKILVIAPTNPQKTGTPIPDSVGGKTYNHVEKSDLNSTATRRIMFNWPNGKVPTTLPKGFHLDKDSTNVVTQTIRFERYAHIDLVTGEVTYCDKNGKIADDQVNDNWDSDPNPAKFPALMIPKIAGYKAKVSLVQNKRTVNKQGLARMYQLFAVNFMALPASVPGDHTIGHEPVDPTKGDDGHKVAPKPGDTTITDDKGGTRVIPGDTDPNKGQDHGSTNPENPNKGKDEGNKGQDHGSTNPDNPNKGKDEGNKGQDHGTTSPDNPNKGKDEGNKGQDHGTTSPDKPNKGNDEGNKGKDEGSTTPVVPTTPSDSSNGQTPVQTPDQKPEDSDKPVDNSNNKGQGDKQDQNDQTENTKKTSKKTTKKNKKLAKDVNKVTREAKEKQREEMRKHPSSTGVGSDDGVLGSPLMGNNGPVAPTQDQAHMAPEVSPSATVQAATLGTHAAVSNSNNLPQTGENASKLGLIGLAFASLGGMVALAGTRKRRED